MFSAILKRDIKTAWSSSGSAATGLAFFGMAYALMTMALGVKLADQSQHALLAISLLLTLMLSLPSMLDQDVQDGSLEQYLILPITRSWLMIAKMVAYWLSHLLPVLLVAGLIMFVTQASDEVDEQSFGWLRLVLMSLWLTSLGAIASVIALLHGKGVFARALIVLPLYLPAIIAATLVDDSSVTLAIQIAATLILFPVSAWIGGVLLSSVTE